MYKVTIFWTIVIIFLLSLPRAMASYNMSEQTFQLVKEELWLMGVEKSAEQELTDNDSNTLLPEELIRPLLKERFDPSL